MQLADPILTFFLGATNLIHPHHQIGIAASGAGYRVNSEAHRGKTSLSCGDIIETRNQMLDLTIDRAEIRLLPLTRSRVCHNVITLESGTIEFAISGRFEIRAGIFKFESADQNTRGAIALTDERRIEASVASGKLHATDGIGLALSDVTHEHGLSLEKFEGATTQEQRYIGCIESKEGRYYLRDESSGTMLEVRGAKVEANLKRRTAVKGVVLTYLRASGTGTFLEALEVMALNESCLCEME